MGHGTSEPPERPVDLTEDRLFAAYKSAEKLADFAEANLADAEVNIQLAKLARDRASEKATAAAIALRKHRDSKR